MSLQETHQSHETASHVSLTLLRQAITSLQRLSLLLPSTASIMPVGIEAWITQIPPITRAWLALAVLTSLAVVRLHVCEGRRR
jgi:hypothetical protein